MEKVLEFSAVGVGETEPFAGEEPMTGSATIPVRLSLEESTAAALLEAAEELSAARDAEHFIQALDTNHRVWMTLNDIATRNSWKLLDRRLAEYAVTTSKKAGCGVRDDDVETLIGINRNVSARLTGGHDLAAIQRRAMLAWQENGRPRGMTLKRWLIAEMERKARFN